MHKKAIALILACSMVFGINMLSAEAEDSESAHVHESDSTDYYHTNALPDMNKQDSLNYYGNNSATLPENDLTCIHGHYYTEQCETCGELTHNSRNIPMYGTSKEYIELYEGLPVEDSLHVLKICCYHGIPDGTYCPECGTAEVEPENANAVWMDSCIHGKVKGEKCEDCKKLKESTDDYVLSDGESMDDPLLYTIAFSSDMSCPWCGHYIASTNVGGCNKVINHRTCLAPYTSVFATGTCSSHKHWRTCSRGHSAAYDPTYSTSHRRKITSTTATCTSSGREYWECVNCGTSSWDSVGALGHSFTGLKTQTITKQPTCQSTGTKRLGTDCIRYSKCYSTQYTYETLPMVTHIIGSSTYKDFDMHVNHCSGNGTAPHDFDAPHTWVADSNGEDSHCSATGCTATKTKLHIDTYTLDASGDTSLLKEDAAVVEVEVKSDPYTIDADDYVLRACELGIPVRSHGKQLMSDQPNDETTNITVSSGGLHMALYYGDISIPNYVTSLSVKNAQDKYIPGSDYIEGGKIELTYADNSTTETPLRKDDIENGYFRISDNQSFGTYPVGVIYTQLTPNRQKINTTSILNSTVCSWLGEDFSAENKSFVYKLDGIEYSKTTSSSNPTIETILSQCINTSNVGTASISEYDGSIIVKDQNGKRMIYEPVSDFAKDLSESTIALYGHTDLNGKYSVQVVNKEQMFRVFIPESISCSIDKNGVASMNQEYSITNSCYTPVQIKNISVNALDGWTLVDPDSSDDVFSSGKNICLKINGYPVKADGTVELSSPISIDQQEQLPLNIEIKASKQSQDYQGNAFDVNYQIDWENGAFTLSDSKIDWTLDGDDHSKQLSVNWAKQEDSSNAITWESNNPDVASVDENGFITMGSQIGTATITAKSGDFTKTCTVIVKEIPNFEITAENRKAIGWTDSTTKLTIPELFTGDGNNGTIKGQKYRVSSIGHFAFSYCSNLTSVTIPDSVTSIGKQAFRDCSKLTSITIPGSVISLGDGIFYQCSELSSVMLQDGVTTIGEDAFVRCKKLTTITLPNSLTSIGEYGFNGTGLTSITLPDSITSIAKSTFSGCTNLTSVTIPNSITSIGEFAFTDCGLISVTIPNSVTSIEHRAFSYNTRLSSVKIPNSITTIGSEAFYSCNSLTSITLPSSITSLDKNTFGSCTALTSITIPQNIESIDSSCFNNCSNLKTITINKSQDSIAGSPWGASKATINWLG